MTQTLIDLRAYAAHKIKDYEKDYEDKSIDKNDIVNKYNYIQGLCARFYSDLSIKLDELIIKYIKNYNPRISNIQQFKSIYEDNYNYLHKMIDKVIDNM